MRLSAASDADGNWSFTPQALTDGSYDFLATVTDAAGNSASSATLTIAIDTAAPQAPADVALVDASGDAIASGALTNSNAPVLSGTAEPGSTVTVSDGDVVLGTATVDEDGSWSFTAPALEDGSHSLTAVVTDAAGNTGPASPALDFTVDTTAPDAIVDLTVSDDVGASQGDLASGDTTDDSTPTLSGTAEANGVVSVYDGDTLLGTTTADASGSWSFTTPVLSNGLHSLAVTVTDAVGNRRQRQHPCRSARRRHHARHHAGAERPDDGGRAGDAL